MMPRKSWTSPNIRITERLIHTIAREKEPTNLQSFHHNVYNSVYQPVCRELLQGVPQIFLFLILLFYWEKNEEDILVKICEMKLFF